MAIKNKKSKKKAIFINDKIVSSINDIDLYKLHAGILHEIDSLENQIHNLEKQAESCAKSIVKAYSPYQPKMAVEFQQYGNGRYSGVGMVKEVFYTGDENEGVNGKWIVHVATSSKTTHILSNKKDRVKILED